MLSSGTSAARPTGRSAPALSTVTARLAKGERRSAAKKGNALALLLALDFLERHHPSGKCHSIDEMEERRKVIDELENALRWAANE